VDLGQFISKYKELVDVVAGVVTVIAFACTVAEGLERRTLESKRDKLLVLIKGLVVVRQESHGDENINWQLDDALAEFTKVSARLVEHSKGKAGVGFFRRVFLIYHPPNRLAWIPHILYWLNVSALGVYVATRRNERDSTTVLGFFFYLGVSLLIRQWGLSELVRGSPEGNSSDWPNRFWSLAEYLYWFIVILCLAAAIHGVYSKEIKEAVTMAGVSIIAVGCGFIVDRWADISMYSEPSPASIKRTPVLLPPAALTVAWVFSMAGDWRSFISDWAHDPSLLLLEVAIIAVPWHAGLSYVYSKPVPTPPLAATAETGSSTVAAGLK
jgi:hypothetical protein